MNAPELLPCPFCGENRASTYYVRDGRVAMCPACGAKSGSQFNGPRDIPSADERAISAWNTRTPDAAALARADALEAALAEAVEAMKDACSALDYIRHHYGDLHGVGFDRVRDKHDATLARIQEKKK